jgi:(heptosyl)LPS beta-1,4-glucosyltransferase
MSSNSAFLSPPTSVKSPDLLAEPLPCETSPNMDLKPTIGVVAISYNEERDLPGFLQHLLPWVDEIVIVDDGSTDRSAQIAQRAGKKVNFLALPRLAGEYHSSQRNKGIKAATSDWLLHMDIDERTTPELRDEILRIVLTADMDAYTYRRFNFFLHRPVRHGNWSRYRSIRFARRDRFHFGGKIHEKSIISRKEPKIGHLDGLMWHYNEPTYELRLKKALRYEQIDAEILLEKKEAITVWHILLMPFAHFFRSYLLRLGFLDGLPGFILGVRTYMGIFDTYVLAWDAQNHVLRESVESEFAKLSTIKENQ